MKIIKNDKIAFIYKEKELTYSNFIDNVTNLSNLLQIKKRERIAIFLENRPEWIYAFFATWERNCINVLIDCLGSVEEVKNILEDSTPKIIFVSNTTLKILENLITNFECEIINIDNISFNLDTTKNESLDYTNRDEELAVILYSSGTTGKAKGIELTFKNLNSNMKSVSDLNIISLGDIMISILQFHHSYPLMVLVLVPLYLNITNVILDKIASDEIFKALQKYKVTIIIGVPRLYNLLHKGIMAKILESSSAFSIFKIMSLVKNNQVKKFIFKKVHNKFGNNIKVLVSGGAKLDPDIIKDFDSLGFQILEGYGLSETSPISAFNTFEYRRIGSVGKALGNIQIKIEDGEILIKGDNVMKRYYNKPNETSEVLKDGWFYTGDLGYIEDEFIHITGRKKELIVLESGKNIVPSEVEDIILKKISYIKEIGVLDREGQLYALILPNFEELTKNNILNIEETIKWEITDRYNAFEPDYKRIYDFTLLSTELPKTRLGKIQRYNLSSLIEIKKSLDFKDIEPDGEDYTILKKYLEDVTKKKVHLKHHIELDLKLDSIEKVDLQFFLEKSFGIDISSEELSKYMIVEQLFYYIISNKKDIDLNQKSDAVALNVKIDKEAKILKIASKILSPIIKNYFKLEVMGLDNLPNENFILAPNHQSFLDANLVGVALPYEVLKDTYFLGTDIYFQNFLTKKLASISNIITVNIDKNLKMVLQQLKYILKKNKNILIFPEGAITRDGKLSTFKNAFSLLSKELNVPVIPVTINGAREAFPLGAKVPRPKKISVTFSKPIYPDNLTHEDISLKTKKVILDNLEKFKGEIHD